MLHVAEGLIGQSPAMTEEQQENTRKRMEANLRETTQQQIERELFTSLLKVLTGPLSLSLQILLFTYAHTQSGSRVRYWDKIFTRPHNIAGVH